MMAKRRRPEEPEIDIPGKRQRATTEQTAFNDPNHISNPVVYQQVVEVDDLTSETNDDAPSLSDHVTVQTAFTALTTPTARHPRYPSDAKTLVCHFPGCNKSYNRPTRLNAHLRSHTNDRPFKCTYDGCDKDYREKKHLDFHIQGSHEKPEKGHVCPVAECGKSFMTATRLRRHQLVHEGKERFRCRDYPPCADAFRKHQTLQRHIRSVHLGGPAFVCKHEGCEEGFPTAAALRRHSEREHGQPKYWCEECTVKNQDGTCSRRGFTTMDLFQAHIKLEHLNCMFCDTRCPSQWDLTSHVEKYHSGISVQDRKVVPCTWEGCNKRFTQKNNMTVHVRTVHEGFRFVCGQTDISDALGLEDWDKDEGCGNGFTSKASLEDHVRFVHCGEERPKAKPVTSSISLLDAVSGAHDAEKRTIPCPMDGCSYKFIRHHDLLKHLESYEHKTDCQGVFRQGDDALPGGSMFSGLSYEMLGHAALVGGSVGGLAFTAEDSWSEVKNDGALAELNDAWLHDEIDMRPLMEASAYPELDESWTQT